MARARSSARRMRAVRASLPSSVHPQTPSLYGSSAMKSGRLF
jgi:hypothetical protein